MSLAFELYLIKRLPSAKSESVDFLSSFYELWFMLSSVDYLKVSRRGLFFDLAAALSQLMNFSLCFSFDGHIPHPFHAPL